MDEKEALLRRENREQGQRQRGAEEKELADLEAKLLFERVHKPDEVYTGMVLGPRTKGPFFRIGPGHPETFTFRFKDKKFDANTNQ